MAHVVLEHLHKAFDQTVIVHDVSLDIADGEFVVLVGPSGCGKTTVLRMLAGLETPTRGSIFIDGRCVNSVEPKDRDIAMVFQNYALYPHMSVFDNMAFGLKMRKVPKSDIEMKVREVAKLLELEHLLGRKPRQLSGGQRQRVALGRAIVRKPKAFLMDEPLSNLDAKLRGQMRREILQLHRQLGATTLYVTHDQAEAMTMGDRIVLLNKGLIQQVGRPLDVYQSPNNLFVAGFIGQMNTLSAVYNHPDQTLLIRSPERQVAWALPRRLQTILEPYHQQELVLCARPEHFMVASSVDQSISQDFLLEVLPHQIEHLGSEQWVYFAFGGSTLLAKLPAETRVDLNHVLRLRLDSQWTSLYDAKSEQRICSLNG